MAFSIQRAVSDGTMTLLPISIEYFDREEISVLFDGVLNARQWAWVGTTDKTLSFTPAVANTVEVMIVRSTDLAALRHQFSLGAQFTAESLDESLLQILHIAQEAREGSNLGEIFQNLDFHGFKATNMGNGTDPGDAVNHAQMEVHDATIVGYMNAASASAAAAAASAAALPNVVGGAGTVPVVNPTGTGWLYKSGVQMVSFLGLGTASGYNVGTVVNTIPVIDPYGVTLTPMGFYGYSAGSDAFTAGPYLRLDATVIQAGAGGSNLDFWTYNAGWGRRFRIGEVGQFGIGGATYGAIGQVLTSGGPSAAPSWTDVASGVTYVYVTTPPNPSAGSMLLKAEHGLGTIPAQVTLEIVCTTPEYGYGVGNVVENPFLTNGAVSYVPLPVSKDGAAGYAVIPNNYALGVLRLDTGAGALITSANWTTRFKFRKS